MQLLVGLGNPGERYARTRHNVGFLALDALANRQGVSFSPGRAESLLAKLRIADRDVLAAKPQTFMNLSGAAVQGLMAYHRIRPEDAYVVVDDTLLDLGRFRVRAGGSHGGHNGLKDIEARIGQAYNRLRIGVGAKPEEWDLADWVLSRFEKEELADLEKRFPALENCLETWILEGPQAAATRFNGPWKPEA
ncbi:MAG TPA: aminoacyl-tRNA hydrolase [Fibrobacteria bacterium]|nr:aminoacyl-tRNA hydrolase [Fibrobacteria bacterium]